MPLTDACISSIIEYSPKILSSSCLYLNPPPPVTTTSPVLKDESFSKAVEVVGNQPTQRLPSLIEISFDTSKGRALFCDSGTKVAIFVKVPPMSNANLFGFSKARYDILFQFKVSF
jgi:hypothetical protein